MNFNKPALKGNNADYSPKYFFEYNGLIYQKMSFERAYQNNFHYRVVDQVKNYYNEVGGDLWRQCNKQSIPR
ncbi:hypothetical protein [Helicobacter sp. 11S02596-1]|uniref:hypothetical protein n=1 Tax=Helicobacter sp. 11S02596-1 TaxID=1476194 RepID=UPI00117BAD98|nr:hypothetical protein [Helicobacter sp. 11S02596-1]